jgi:hemerythrin-like domain-containing protein
VKLSHDHHAALETALRLRRATAEDLPPALRCFRDFWDERGSRHFALEEAVLRADLLDDPRWHEAVARMLAEHDAVRARASAIAQGTVDDAHALGALLHDHVRFEERVLFLLLEDELDPPSLASVGLALSAAREAAGPA